MEHIVFAGLHEYYNSIALEHYSEYVVSNKLYKELTNNNQSWDFLLHSSEENARYYQLCIEKQRKAIISIVFEAFAVESFINCYGTERLGKKLFDEKYQMLGVTDKYIIISREVTGKDFPKGINAFRMLKELVSVRNNLVHSKCVEIDMFNEDLQEFYDLNLSLLGNGMDSLFNIIDRVIYTYKVLKQTISELEKEI
jgi:hypothetical protein